MRVLVTGSEGYLGTVLVPRLAAAGHRVARLDRLLFEGCEADPYDASGLWRTDFRDLSQEDLSSYDAVIHLAALANDPLSDLDPALTYDINFRAAVELARRARSAGVQRFVLSSTCSVYGAHDSEMVTEAHSPAPITPYARSKWMAEEEISTLGSAEFGVTHLRHGTVYGWSPMVRFDLVVNNFVANARLNGDIRLTSDGSAWRPLVHVEDCARAFVASLEADFESVAGQVFNIGRTEDNIRVLELAERVAALLPGCPVEMAPGASADKRSYRVDFTKAQTQLQGFLPQWTVDDGIAELVRHIERMPEARLRQLLPGRIAHLGALLRSGRLARGLQVPA